MAWNIAPECISLVMLGIVWMYSLKSVTAPSLKNKLFQTCFLVTFTAMASNIISTVMITYYDSVPMWMTWAITTLYFIATPLMGLVYFLYSASVIYEKNRDVLKIIRFWMLPGIAYIILIIVNSYNRIVFDLDPVTGYSQGEYIMITYIVFYAYCLLSVFLVATHKNVVERKIYFILSSFPVLALLVIVVQQLYPSIMLSGSAATAALLIIYLHLQNKQISTDYLTNLANNTELLNRIEFLIDNHVHNFTLIVISLREFKQINANYGHDIGDTLLKSVSEYLVGRHNRIDVFRFKGDEFAVLIKNSEKDDIITMLNHIRARINEPWIIKDIHCAVGCAIGVVHYPQSAQIAEHLINGVEYAVAKAKQQNIPLCYCDHHMLAEVERKKQIHQILKEKLKKDEFDVFYQPIYSLDHQNFFSAESLLRICDSALGPLYPNEFIPIAEESGLIIDITYQVIDKVCKCINALIAENVPISAIHINFSAIQFKEENLSEKVLNVIRKNHTPCDKIKIEFTESGIVENLTSATNFAIEMKKYGILMGLDDFGTSYSNISMVVNLPFSTVKLDKSLVWAAIKQEKSAITVKHLIQIFKDLHMKVVAEGVEDIVQDKFCHDSKVDQIQGFYYAKPMPEKDFKSFLQEKIKK